MRPYPNIRTEEARLTTLAEYGLSADDSQIDVAPLLRLAKSLFDVPTVLLSLVERHRQVFAARLGLDVCETDRNVSFCAHALEREDVLFIPDAALDPRFCDNPLVTGAPYIRFYAGQPLITPSGHTIGTLCLIGPTVRTAFTAEDRANLKSLADLVLDKLEMHRLARAQQDSQARFERISATSPDSIICADHHGRITFWNASATRLFGYEAQEAVGKSIDLIVPTRMRGGHGGGLHRVATGGPPRLVGTVVELPAQRRDGSEFPIELSLSMWRENGEASFGSIIRDISERRANEDRLYRLAHFDALTELPNRAVLRRRLEEVVYAGTPASLISIDLDGFKDVNDTLGHSAGDGLLKVVATRLMECAGASNTVARLGGDEFAVLMPHSGDPLAAAELADCIIESLSDPFDLDGEVIHIAASAGIALFPLHGERAEDLLASADMALYQAKDEGRRCRRFFTPALRRSAIAKRELEGELQRAVGEGQLELFYQPQVRASDGCIVGAEALLRWRHPERGIVSPAAFLPALESGRLASRVGEWVIRTACLQAAAWRTMLPCFRMGVNLFGVQFRTGDLAASVRAALIQSNLPAANLELEITENIILHHDSTMLAPLRELRSEGVGVAFDDYGTGYASLSQLKRFPLTRLKIDQGFVRSMCESPEDAAIVRAVALLGRSFGLEVIAEGVETAQQQAMLTAEGCHELQGYLFGRPMPAAQFSQTFLKPSANRVHAV